jgi:hypothetical protein
MQLTDQQLARRLEDLQDVIANQKLEGLELDIQTKTDLESEARGEITLEEVRTRICKRIENGEL